MSQTETGSLTSLSNGPENGVAPRPGLPVPPPYDDECRWVAEHKAGWQEGEQGVILAIVRHLQNDIPEDSRWCVEFGAGDASDTLPLTCAPVMGIPEYRAMLIEPNTALLRRLVNRVNPERATVIEATVAADPESTNRIDHLMKEWGAPPNPAVMVVDVDSIDYHIVEGMESRPVVLCVEHLDADSPQHKQRGDVPHVPTQAECGTLFDDLFGAQEQANAAAFDAMLGGRGYALVFRTRFNSVYVRGDMVPRLRKRKLNLGAGPTDHPGYVKADIKTGTDIRKPLDFPDATFDEVYLSHVLEHVPREERLRVMGECHRVLKPWGTLRIAVPDMTKIAKEVLNPEPTFPWNYLESVVYGGKMDENDRHDSMYRESDLRDLFYKAGFGEVDTFKPFMSDTTTHPLSLNMQGRKRWFPKVENPRIALVMSQPELTHSGHEESLLSVMKETGLDFEPARGAFWDRDMTLGTLNAIEKYDPDFLLYSDYDSDTDGNDVRTLIEWLNNNPTAAAVGAVQMSRHDDLPLVMEPDIDYSGDVTRVRFQHFGLMLVRREVFEEMPQPWFWSVPGKDQNGNWDWRGWGRTDADITFWRNMDALGLPVYQHNRVCIGHNIRAIKYPRPNGSGVMIVPIENRRRMGKPKTIGFSPEVYAERLRRKHGIQTDPPKREDATISELRGAGVLPSGTEVPPAYIDWPKSADIPVVIGEGAD